MATCGVILRTARLALRQFTEDDVDNLLDLNSDPEVMRYLTGGTPTPREVIPDEIIAFHLAVYERLQPGSERGRLSPPPLASS